MPVHAANFDFRQTSCTPGTVTVAWTNYNQPYDGSSETRVTRYELSTEDGRLQSTSFGSYETSATIYNLPSSYIGYANIKVYYTITNYYSSGRSYSNSYTRNQSVRICTQPPTVQKKHFVVNAGSSYAYVKVAKTNSSYTSHLQVYQGNKCVVNNADYYGGSFSIKANTVYKYRVKYSYKNYNNGANTTFESANWSPWRYFVVPSLSGKAKSNKKGFTLTLKRAAGVSSYKVYISKKSGSGYKLSTTVKLGSKSKKTVTITKNRKKRATNYVRVIPQIKGYGPSDVYGGGSIYVYK